MNDLIEVDGAWYPCEFSFPHQAAPVPIPGFGGVISWQRSPYRQYDALVRMAHRGPIIRSGEYRVMTGQRTLIFQLCKAEVLDLWGNVRE